MCKSANNSTDGTSFLPCAIFTATLGGIKLALRVREVLGQSTTIFVKEIYASPLIENCVTYTKLSVAVHHCFQPYCPYSALIFIMAAGIAVRVLAPHIRTKLYDPAVVVLDECGRHVISLLSGHVGGANDLTRYLADALHSDAVITTATDMHDLLAPDVIAGRLALDPWPKENIRRLNTALLAGEKITWLTDANLPHQDFWRGTLAERGIIAQTKGGEWPTGSVVLLTERIKLPRVDMLALTPRYLIVGVGCRRNTAAAAIMAALTDACRWVWRNTNFIIALATTTAKRDEPGLKTVADELRVPLYYGDNIELQQQIDRYKLTESDFVRQTIGIGNVAEAAALAYWHNALGNKSGGKFALTKTKYEKVTVALLWNQQIKALT